MSIFKPIQDLSNLVTYSWLGIPQNSYLGNTINFFIYDVIKIGILLVVINYFMAIVRYYFPMDKTRHILTQRNWHGFDYLLAALLGVITPFCSCSSIPLFIGFISAGIPLGVTLAFLISSPLVNEASLYLFPSVFGPKVTLIYNVLGIVIAMTGGFILQKFHMEKYIRPEFLAIRSKPNTTITSSEEEVPLATLLSIWATEARTISITVFPYVVMGVGLGALIHGFIPSDLVNRYLTVNNFWTVPIAVLLGTPLYTNSIGVVPVMEAMVGKGVPLGTALAFMTASVTVSIPEGLMLSKIMRKELLAAFFGITLIGIMILGFVFNA